MRIAVIGDIHGNLPAFETVLTDINRHAPDLLVIVGDIVVGSPDSLACWQLAMSLNCPMVRGNHERYVMHFGTEQAEPLWSTEQFAPVQWAVAQLGEERQEIATLPLALRLPAAPGLLIVHASAHSDTASVPLHSTKAELAEIFPDVAEQTIIRGHNHIPRTHPWDERQVVTTGSAGLPLEGHAVAQYVLLDQQRYSAWHAQHCSVPYPVEQTLQRFVETNYVAETGPMGRLFQREVATSTLHFVPFLRYYRQWLLAEPDLSLTDGLERYFRVF